MDARCAMMFWLFVDMFVLKCLGNLKCGLSSVFISW